MKTFKTTLIALFAVISSFAISQNDTLISLDNTILFGEISSMDRGIIKIETSFSDDDFTIEWDHIKEISSNRLFTIILSNGDHLYGTIDTDTASKQIIINDEKKGVRRISFEDLVYLNQMDKGNILDVMNLSLDVGYSYTKSSDLHQLNGSFKADYITDKWGLDGYYNTVQNSQKDADPLYRTNAGIGVKVFLLHDIFGSANADYFSNNEMMLDLRSNYVLSIGKYFIRTNQIYFNSSVGISYTIENYADTITDLNSIEGKFSLEYNMFDIGDLNLLTKLSLFPSFTEKGRMRTNFNFTVKYDLPRDFYIKGSIDYQYDNKPIEGVGKDDYVYTIGFGWEL